MGGHTGGSSRGGSPRGASPVVYSSDFDKLCNNFLVLKATEMVTPKSNYLMGILLGILKGELDPKNGVKNLIRPSVWKIALASLSA